MVCSALDTVTQKRFAIKKVKGAFQIQVITKRTLRELLLLRHFYAHDNIISVLTILQPPPDPRDYSDVYLVMDLQESDLHRIIHSQQPLTEEHLRYFLYQTLRGLMYVDGHANLLHSIVILLRCVCVMHACV